MSEDDATAVVRELEMNVVDGGKSVGMGGDGSLFVSGRDWH